MFGPVTLMLLAGGGIYAAFHGMLGAAVQAKASADVTALKAKVSAEIAAVETSASADVKALVAKIKALL